MTSVHVLTIIDVCCATVVILLSPVTTNTVTRPHQVVDQGFASDLAIRAYGNPSITNSSLSRELFKAVNARTKAIVDKHCATNGLVTLANSDRTVGGDRKEEDGGT